MEVDLRARIRDVPDFPTEGIVFKDITPLVADPVTFRETIDRLAAWAGERQPDIILGAEARGFIFGGALAYTLGCGFVPARKPGNCRGRRSRRRTSSSTAGIRSRSTATPSAAAPA